MAMKNMNLSLGVTRGDWRWSNELFRTPTGIEANLKDMPELTGGRRAAGKVAG